MILGFFFCALSLSWCAYLQHTYTCDLHDLRHEAGAAFAEGDDADDADDADDGASSAASEAAGSDAPLMPAATSHQGGSGGGGDLELANLRRRGAAGGDVAAAATAEAALENEDTAKSLRQLPTMRPDEFVAQASADDGRLLLAIDGIVYDLQSFAAKHPGGVAPLQRHRGSLTATANFEAVGHSLAARRQMRQFAVALLPPEGETHQTYEQRMASRKEAILEGLAAEKRRKVRGHACATIGAILSHPQSAPARPSRVLPTSRCPRAVSGDRGAVLVREPRGVGRVSARRRGIHEVDVRLARGAGVAAVAPDRRALAARSRRRRRRRAVSL